MNTLLKNYTGNTYNEFYEWYRKNKSRLENIPECQSSAKELLKNINNKKHNWLKIKIDNHIERNGLNTETTTISILQKIVNDIDSCSLLNKIIAI